MMSDRTAVRMAELSALALLMEFAASCPRPSSMRISTSSARRCAARRKSGRAGSAVSRWWKPASAEDLGQALRGPVLSAAATKARMDKLVDNLLSALSEGLTHLDWMGPRDQEAGSREARPPASQRSAIRTSGAITAALVIRRDDLIGNVMRANEFEFRYQLGKLGKPVDHDEWLMTPQTVNAYYRPDLNEIVFPAAYPAAAVLRPAIRMMPPTTAAIGATIGHEISHGFDDEGSQFDASGICTTGGPRRITSALQPRPRRWWRSTTRSRPCRAITSMASSHSGRTSRTIPALRRHSGRHRVSLRARLVAKFSKIGIFKIGIYKPVNWGLFGCIRNWNFKN